MQQAAKKLFEAAMQLPEEDRQELAQELSVTINGGFSPAELEQEWMAEIERRSQEIDAGTATLVDWSEVQQRIAQRRAGRGG
jgi:putative addiction module component (TIGR02574 family)